jgi:hypothetical protein
MKGFLSPGLPLECRRRQSPRASQVAIQYVLALVAAFDGSADGIDS